MQSNYHKILFKFLCSSTFHIISLQWHPTPLFLRIHGNAHAGIRSCTHMQSTKGIWSQCLPLRAVDLSSVLCDILILSGYSLPIHPVLLQSHTHLGIRLLSPLPLSPSASVPFNVLCAQRVGDLESHRINLQHQNTHTHKQQTGPRHSGVHPQKSPSYCPSEFQKWRTKSEESTWSLHLTNTRMHARHWQGKADYLWQTRCHFYVLLLRDSGGGKQSRRPENTAVCCHTVARLWLNAHQNLLDSTAWAILIIQLGIVTSDVCVTRVMCAKVRRVYRRQRASQNNQYTASQSHLERYIRVWGGARA